MSSLEKQKRIDWKVSKVIAVNEVTDEITGTIPLLPPIFKVHLERDYVKYLILSSRFSIRFYRYCPNPDIFHIILKLLVFSSLPTLSFHPINKQTFDEHSYLTYKCNLLNTNWGRTFREANIWPLSSLRDDNGKFLPATKQEKCTHLVAEAKT